jgi:hypothetical protein
VFLTISTEATTMKAEIATALALIGVMSAGSRLPPMGSSCGVFVAAMMNTQILDGGDRATR